MAKGETVRIGCDLEANPREVQFTWKFNNSMEAVEIPADVVESDGAHSVVSYTPINEQDYGTLLCAGNNEQGAQTEPCVFLVVPAGEYIVRYCQIIDSSSLEAFNLSNLQFLGIILHSYRLWNGFTSVAANIYQFLQIFSFEYFLIIQK